MIYWYMIITMLVTWGKKIPRLPTMNRNNNGYCMVLSGIDDVCVCVRNLYRNTSNMVQIVRGRTTNGLVISSHHSQILQVLSGCPGLYSWPNRNSRCDTKICWIFQAWMSPTKIVDMIPWTWTLNMAQRLHFWGSLATSFQEFLAKQCLLVFSFNLRSTHIWRKIRCSEKWSLEGWGLEVHLDPSTSTHM